MHRKLVKTFLLNWIDSVKFSRIFHQTTKFEFCFVINFKCIAFVLSQIQRRQVRDKLRNYNIFFNKIFNFQRDRMWSSPYLRHLFTENRGLNANHLINVIPWWKSTWILIFGKEILSILSSNIRHPHSFTTGRIVFCK